MAELVGNLLVAQSGGPTAVINASLAGVIQEAGRHECIEEIYGGANGILGVLNEDLVDINEEKAKTIEGLKYTPAAALGTCRYKLDFKKRPEQAAKDMDRLFEVFQAHNIRYFFYIGGNDSQDTAHKIHEQAIARGYEMRINGVPKTIDNDLPETDHCPGMARSSSTTGRQSWKSRSMLRRWPLMAGAAAWLKLWAGARVGSRPEQFSPGVRLMTPRTLFSCRKLRSMRKPFWLK